MFDRFSEFEPDVSEVSVALVAMRKSDDKVEFDVKDKLHLKEACRYSIGWSCCV